MINAIIVDDELSALESLKWELSSFCPDVKILDSFTNPLDAISAINYLKPNVVFLDIEMPELDGFQLLEKLTYRNFDLIITTAYNQYAIQAFKANAIDYLLKPIDPDELIRTMNRLKTNYKTNTLNGAVENIFNNILSQRETLQSRKIPLALSDKVIMVNANDILYCESDGNYTKVFLENNIKHLLSKSIKHVSKILPKSTFLRVHKKYIVNINSVVEYIRGDGGEIIIKNKENIPVSRSHKTELLEALQIS